MNINMTTMVLKDLNVNKISSIISQEVENMTCIECCKYYVVPTTASCGHSLCHSCWRGRRTCPFCDTQVEKKNLKLNLPLQSLKDHVNALVLSFENLFDINLDEFLLDTSEDPNKHVNEWLASSQNLFSAAVVDSQQSVQNQIQSVEQVTSKIQIHSKNTKNQKPIEVIHIPPIQVDWDKIEEMPEMENMDKDKLNPVGPMDIEPFDLIEDDKYSNEHPRRSSRNKENNNNLNMFSEISSDTKSKKGSNLDSNNKSHKLGKNWNNVKRMKKEFSKLNKKNRNKLNVSIEMCKKTQNISNKAVPPNSQKILYDIDDISSAGPDDNNKVTKADTHDYIDEVTDESKKEINKEKNKNISNISKDSSKVQNFENTEIKLTKNVHHITKEISKDNEETRVQKVSFFKKSALNKLDPILKENDKGIYISPNENSNTDNTDDIEITIKIGSILTNICIKKKDNDVQLKINADRKIQTSVETVNADNKKSASCSPILENNLKSTHVLEEMNIDEINKDAFIKYATPKIQISEKSTSSKKNTASAETATAQFEITESVEREFNNVMDNVLVNKEQNKVLSGKITENDNVKGKYHSQSTTKKCQNMPEDMEYLNDLDIFDSESVKEGNVQTLKDAKNTPSAIFVPTVKSNKIKSQKEKRNRDAIESEDLPSKKKMKIIQECTNVEDNVISEQENVVEHDSENINYDVIINQVFANIDADIDKIKNTTKKTQPTKTINCNNKISQTSNISSSMQDTNVNISNKDNQEYDNQKCSENIFSVLEKELPGSEIMEITQYKTLKHVREDSIEAVKITNKIGAENESNSQTKEIEIVEPCTPLQDDDDSDKSIVEETPQKSVFYSKNKSKNEIMIDNNTQPLVTKSMTNPTKQLQVNNQINKNNEDSVNLISLSDSLGETSKTSKNVTVVETVPPRPTLETPLTITKFVDQIKHKSTPMARKSLKFTSQNIEENPEQTLCPSSFVAAKTTQEKEFMEKAFDQTQNSPIQSLHTGKNLQRTIKFCVAGSCLSSSEQANLKLLCLKRNWTYVDKYIKELTHLVVGVDEEKKSQRSVKYMCALAGAKWIVSYNWIERCLQTNDVVAEEPFEALDGTGEPGPRRSRIAKQKLFQGITFYCMPPFSVLDVDTLKDILESAGGRVVNEARLVRATTAPALLLAEPEHTQEDRFIYLAMELSIVPVNYEWVLNCLGSYTLGSIYELLLCPASLLPPVTSKWPQELLFRDSE